MVVFNRAHVSNRVFLITKDNKNMNYIIYFNYNIKDHYTSTYTKLEKNHNTVVN